eukprot:3084305-Prymnesium_polylepis.3
MPCNRCGMTHRCVGTQHKRRWARGRRTHPMPFLPVSQRRRRGWRWRWCWRHKRRCKGAGPARRGSPWGTAYRRRGRRRAEACSCYGVWHDAGWLRRPRWRSRVCVHRSACLLCAVPRAALGGLATILGFLVPRSVPPFLAPRLFTTTFALFRSRAKGRRRRGRRCRRRHR